MTYMIQNVDMPFKSFKVEFYTFTLIKSARIYRYTVLSKSLKHMERNSVKERYETVKVKTASVC